MVQLRGADRCPAVVLTVHGRGHVAEVRRGTLEARLRRRGHVGVHAEARIDRGKDDGQQGDPDEGDHEPRAQIPAQTSRHSFASR